MKRLKDYTRINNNDDDVPATKVAEGFDDYDDAKKIKLLKGNMQGLAGGKEFTEVASDEDILQYFETKNEFNAKYNELKALRKKYKLKTFTIDYKKEK